MGQGSDSCGGYEVDYDPYEEGMENGEWTTKGGGAIAVKDMAIGHLHGARRVAKRAAHEATFEDDREKWEHWVDIFDTELERRDIAPKTPKALKAPAKPVRGTKITMICHCGQEYDARQADIKRKQGLSCSKRCAGIRREYGRPPAKKKPV